MADQGVDAILTAALSTLDLPVTRLKRSSKADTYLTYQLINAREVNPSDDDAEQTEHFFRVDLFTRQDHVELVKRLKTALNGSAPALEPGEPAFTTDAAELYTGTDSGEVLLNPKDGTAD